MEMEQLLSMGFPQDMAAQALAVTGGKSTLKATEWILRHKPNNSNHSNPNPNPNNPSPFQPKLDRFFQSKNPTTPDSVSIEKDPNPEESFLNRPKPWPWSSSHRSSLEKPHSGAIEKESNDEEQSLPKRPKPFSWSSPSSSFEKPHEPLSERMRPRSIDEVVGQDHLLGKNCVIRSALHCDRLPSIVFWGPPGTGKTSIARAIVNSAAPLSYRFVSLSAVTAGVKDVRECVEEAKKIKKKNKRTVLFVDEVHRFNKSQQDSFLPVIEDGSVVFMGATTENPSFHLITPLLSRCRVLTLNQLQPHHIAMLLTRATDDVEKGVARSVGVSVTVEEKAVEFISLHCDGDARVALNALELSAITAVARRPVKQSGLIEADPSTFRVRMFDGDGDDCGNLIGNEENGDDPGNLIGNEDNGVGSPMAVITLDDTKEALQRKHVAYDRDGEEHYNLISALHKSMRGNDANAAIYWLARMLEGGEEPLYIARRLIRFASEDVGLADASALGQAVTCYQACHFLGMPECNVNLAQCVAYLALAPKSVAVYKAIGAAQKMVKESAGQNKPVPLHLRNAPTKLMKDLGNGKDYIYPPDHPSSSQTYLPDSLQNCKFLDLA